MVKYLACCLAVGSAHAIGLFSLMERAMAMARAGTSIPSSYVSALRFLGFPVSMLPDEFFVWVHNEFGGDVVRYGYIAVNSMLWGLVGGIILGSVFSSGETRKSESASQDAG